MTIRWMSTCLIRRWPVVAVLAVAMALVFSPGCLHRRSAMRPVCVSPAPATLVPNDCPPAAVSPGFAEPAGAPSILAPVPSSPPSPVPPASEEPDLKVPKSSATNEPNLQGPSASLGTNRRGASRAALRSQLKSFVNDPDDLFVPPKADRPWKYVVLHHSAHASGSYAQIDREHRQVQGWDGCGYHFVIGNGSQSPDGLIEVAQRWSSQKAGAHCRNGKTPEVNEYGIGICLVGNFDQSPPTPRQVEAARALVAYLSDRYAIPSDHIGTHAALANGPTACPGKNFPAAAVLGQRNMAMHTAF
jgi:N-acetylmuramoyl-L-alanine amidase-like protein